MHFSKIRDPIFIREKYHKDENINIHGVLYSSPCIPAGIRRNLVDSGRFWEFCGMEILAVLPAKIVIFVP